MARSNLLTLGLGLAGGALGLAALASGGEDGGNPKGPVDIPGSAKLPWPTVDAAICAIWESGTKTGAGIVAELWKRTYPGKPYPLAPGAHASQAAALQALGARVGIILQRVPVCGDEGPTEPPPPTDGGDTPGERARTIQDATTQREGGLFQVPKDQSPTSWVTLAYGLQGSKATRKRQAIRCGVQSVFNLVHYGIRQPGNDYGRGSWEGRWYDLSRAFLPRNQNVLGRVLADQPVRRAISWSGAALPNGGTAFGLLWCREVERAGQLIACSEDIFAPEANPPADVLAAMGWTLEGLREAFLASPLAA